MKTKLTAVLARIETAAISEARSYAYLKSMGLKIPRQSRNYTHQLIAFPLEDMTVRQATDALISSTGGAPNKAHVSGENMLIWKLPADGKAITLTNRTNNPVVTLIYFDAPGK